MFFIRKNLILHREINSGAINEINNRNPVFHGDLLGAQVLFSSDRKPCPGFHGGIVGHNHAGATGDLSHHYDYPTRGTSSILLVHAVTGKGADFHRCRSRIQQHVDSLPGSQFPQFMLLIYLLLAAAEGDDIHFPLHLADEQFHGIFVF